MKALIFILCIILQTRILYTYMQKDKTKTKNKQKNPTQLQVLAKFSYLDSVSTFV
jgi:hypothetical protein